MRSSAKLWPICAVRFSEKQRDADYQLFLHQFIFLEESRDSYLAAEHYVLIGGFENDPDSFGNIPRPGM